MKGSFIMVRKIIFEVLGIVGVIVISILAFIIPSDPFKIIPSYTLYGFDKPLWLAIIIVGVFFYLVILVSIYDCLKKRC